MIVGVVDSDGVPQIHLPIAGREYLTVVDTGYNGDFELPSGLREVLAPVAIGTMVSNLAAGMTVEEDYFSVVVPFDGEMVEAEVTFVEGDEILLGTHLLRNHRLTIDFTAGTVLIERATAN
jgi:predicted aspartyl protease